MNPTEQTAVNMLEAYGVNAFGQTVVPALTVQVIANPQITDAQLVSTEDGTVKHAVRKKIGWALDLVWPFVSTYVDQAITAAIPEARAAAQAVTSPQ